MAEGATASVRELAEASQVARHEVIAQVLKEAQPYIEGLRGQTLVIKLGGSTLDNQRDVLEDIVWLRSLGAHPVLVHGGGAEINEWLERLGLPHRFKRGLRVTDAATLNVVRMVLAGKVNGELVRLVGELGGHAVGLTGLDGGLLRARRLAVDLGYVGTIAGVDRGPIDALSGAGYIPVIAPLALSEGGEVLNINADDAAADLARGLHAAKLLYLSDVPGILDVQGELISVLTDEQVRVLIANGVIRGGMIPKAEAALRALETTGRIHIIDGRDPHVLIRELFTREGAGTMIERARH
ncbi:MAG TPA: acetylglutamate kinase [Ktedonobacterales bacterium]|jgi:acetylglutamate kinase|nr:acetylglutamate kinase [Ktedonobacterales bacterium]